MVFCIYYRTFISLVWMQTTLSMILLNNNPSFSTDSDTDNDVADFIISKGYLPNEKDLPKTSIIKNADNDVTYLLSKLTDGELIKLLNDQPNKNEYDLKDLVNMAVDSKPIQAFKPIVDFGKNQPLTSIKDFLESHNNFNEKSQAGSKKNSAQGAIFRLENREVDPFATSKDADPQYAAQQKLHNLLYSRPTDVDMRGNSDDDDEKKELLFDVLVAQLKTLCCKKNKSNKKKDKPNYKTKSLLNDFAPQNLLHKAYIPSIESKPSAVTNTIPNEYMFLILNDEIRSNGSDGLISVDPESLGKNSSVLLLGPIATPLSDAQLKLAMTRISNELSKPEYLPLLHQLSDGTISNENVRLVNSLVTGPETRRYIKPHRCNHQSKLAKVYGGPKWIICTGYLNINTPSLYD